MDEQEVERIATLMHQGFRDFIKQSDPSKPESCPFTELTERVKGGYRAAARAIIADRLSPGGGGVGVVDEYAPTFVVKAS